MTVFLTFWLFVSLWLIGFVVVFALMEWVASWGKRRDDGWEADVLEAEQHAAARYRSRQ